MDLAFYGRVSTEDAQDPIASHDWQLARARSLVEPLGHQIIAREFFDIGQSRALPWKRREAASALLEAIKKPDRGFDGIVIGEPQRAFYGAQFALTFPLLTYYRVSLWVPEVGGVIDPDSEAHDMMMQLYGGMSKGERNRLRKRTVASMTNLAATTDRFLGGRPPYGYRLVDAGPHPNKSKSAAGQRMHRLEPDPFTAPTVRRIFELYATGKGYRAIAEILTVENVPSPSAYDPVRNTHRDPRGWSYGTVRSILANPTYTGYRVWGKQEKVESLYDVDDVAAGTKTVMRWRQQSGWIRPVNPTHEALVPVEMVTLSAGGAERKPRPTVRTYPLRGILFCAACGRRMIASTHKSGKDGERVVFTCDITTKRTSPDAHRTWSVSEKRVQDVLDDWIFGELTDPTWLVQHQGADVVSEAEMRARAELQDARRRRKNLVSAIEATDEPPASLVERLSSVEKDCRSLEARVEQAKTPREGMTEQEIAGLVNTAREMRRHQDVLNREQRAEIYQALGVRLDYDHAEQAVRPCVQISGVRKGTHPLSVRGPWLSLAV